MEKEKRDKSKIYILDTLKIANWMKAKRIVIHTGSASESDRETHLKNAIDVFRELIPEADAAGYSDITLCPEVLGKLNQLGSLEEILVMCQVDERIIPTVDFAHLHARGMGRLNKLEDFEEVIEIIENTLGYERLKKLHIHFSRVEFTRGGERRHRAIDETEYGPEFKFLAQIIVRKKLEPVIICESRENMAEDALKLKKIYEDVRKQG